MCPEWTKLYTGLPEVDYPFEDKTVTIIQCGRICLASKKINVSSALAGQKRLPYPEPFAGESFSGASFQIILKLLRCTLIYESVIADKLPGSIFGRVD